MDFPAIPAPCSGFGVAPGTGREGPRGHRTTCQAMRSSAAACGCALRGVASLDVEEFLEAADGPPRQGAGNDLSEPS